MNGWRYLLAVATLATTLVAAEVLVGRSVRLVVPLSQFPLQLSGWTGRAEPIPAAVVRRTHPDEFISRRYTDPMDHRMLLYVGYYAREASRAQVMAVCWACDILGVHPETLDIQGRPLAVNLVRVRQHDGVEEMIVYWFQSGDRAYRDPYRGKLAQLVRALRSHRSEGALIRVTTPMAGDHETHATLIAFVRAVVPALRRHFQD